MITSHNEVMDTGYCMLNHVHSLPRIRSNGSTSLASSQIWVLLATILGSSMAFVDGTVVNVALSALQAAFHVTGVTLQWLVEGYTLSLASLMLLGGSFGDLYGRKKVFLIGVTLFAGASVACGAAPTFEVMVASRAIQGIGGALLIPGSLSLISSSFSEEQRGKAIGIWSGSTAIAVMIGPVFGGWLVEHTSWRWIFLLNVPLAIAILWISIFKVPESKNPLATRPDWLGAILAAVGLWLCVFALIESAHRSFLLLAVGLLGVVFLGVFLVWETRTVEPMVPLSLFCTSGFSIANVITLLVYASLTGTLYYLPLHLIQIQHYSATMAGASFLPISILISIFSRFSGTIASRFGPRVPLAVGSCLCAGGYALLLRTSASGAYWTSVFPGIFVLGLGLATMVAPLTTTVMNSVGAGRSGTASGINNAISNLASLLAISVFGILFSKAFNAVLLQGLRRSSLSLLVQENLYSHRLDMGGLGSLAGPAGQPLIDAAFVESLHRVLLTAIVLSLLAVFAACMLKDPTLPLGSFCATDERESDLMQTQHSTKH